MDDPTNGPKINYELVYKLRNFNTNSLSNLEVQYANEARARAKKEHEKYIEAIEKHSGFSREDFEVTNIACMAEGILSHVYAGPYKVKKGIGQRRCLFCGCDDFDD